MLDRGDALDSYRAHTLATGRSQRLMVIPENDVSPKSNSVRGRMSHISAGGVGGRRPRKVRHIPDFVWYYVMCHVDLRFILTRLMALNKGTHDLLRSLNSALFDIFLRSYGLCFKLRRTELPGKLNLIPFL